MRPIFSFSTRASAFVRMSGNEDVRIVRRFVVDSVLAIVDADDGFVSVHFTNSGTRLVPTKIP